MKITRLGETIDEKYYKFLDSEFEKHSRENGIVCNYRPFTFIAEDDDKLIGIIMGSSYYDEVAIDNVIVSKEYRHQNIGSQLVNTVIEAFRGKGFSNVSLTTHEFQALDFYKKLGFELEFTRENKGNYKLTKYFLNKNY